MDKNFNEWQEICRVFCEQHGYTLLFVNTDNFGFEDDKGNLCHWNAEKLAEFLKGEK